MPPRIAATVGHPGERDRSRAGFGTLSQLPGAIGSADALSPRPSARKVPTCLRRSGDASSLRSSRCLRSSRSSSSTAQQRVRRRLRRCLGSLRPASTRCTAKTPTFVAMLTGPASPGGSRAGSRAARRFPARSADRPHSAACVARRPSSMGIPAWSLGTGGGQGHRTGGRGRGPSPFRAGARRARDRSLAATDTDTGTTRSPPQWTSSSCHPHARPA